MKGYFSGPVSGPLFTASKRFIKTIFLLTLAAGTFAQTTTKGSWKATVYPDKIVKLTWTHGSMKNNEAIGDAVIAKPASTTFDVKYNTGQVKAPVKPMMPAEDIGPGPIIRGTPSGVKVIYRQTVIEIVNAYDSGHQRGFKVKMQPSEHWFGGGERTLPMERNGQKIPLYNAPHYGYELNADELNYSVPFVLNTNGYGILFDNPSKGYLDFGKSTPGILEAGFTSGALIAYIIPGETPAQILERYASLTGKQPLPPRWAFGNFISRFGYRSQQQAIDVVNKMKAERFPADAVVIDIFWFGDSIKGTLGNLDWMNKAKWPDPKAMIESFRQQNINTILVTEPFVLKGTKNFEASKPFLSTDAAGQPFMLTDFYFGYGGLLDLFNPAARNWFWQFYKKQTDAGVAGWWGDLGEPEKHPEGLHHNLQSFGVKRRMSSNEVHNMYGHMWSKMLFENWRQYYPDRRLFYLNRAGYAGSQRYSVFPWTGDVSRTWNGFRAQLPNLQSMSLSGVPYIHSDAGGFTNVPENDQELYVRWLQMSAFSPVFRPHGTAFGDLEPGVNDLPSEPAFKDDPYKSIARDLINQRYSLLPYLYTLAWDQTANGHPLIRPMIYHGIADEEVLKATDQYMFGDAFLVAPVLEKNADKRKLFIPSGQWYNWRNNKMMTGGQWIEHPVTLSEMPVFVKAGTVIPMWEAQHYNSTADYNASTPLTFRYFPGTTSVNGFLYDDDGNDPKALENENAHQLLSWTNQVNGNQVSLKISAVNWPEGLSREFKLQLPPGTALPFEITEVTLNGKPVELQPSRQPQGWLEFPFSFEGGSIEFVFRKK